MSYLQSDEFLRRLDVNKKDFEEALDELEETVNSNSDGLSPLYSLLGETIREYSYLSGSIEELVSENSELEQQVEALQQQIEDLT